MRTLCKQNIESNSEQNFDLRSSHVDVFFKNRFSVLIIVKIKVIEKTKGFFERTLSLNNEQVQVAASINVKA